MVSSIVFISKGDLMNINALRSHDKNHDFFITKLNIPVNGEVFEKFFICDRGIDAVSDFTQFLYDNMKEANFTLRDKSPNTIKNFYLTYLIRFLNYVFNEADKPIKNIEDLTFELGEEFLQLFSNGQLPNDKYKKMRNRESVDKANRTLSHFYYWLCIKRDKDRKKKYRMKYFFLGDLEFHMVSNKNEFNDKSKQVLSNCFIVDTTESRYSRGKVVQASNYTIRKLIKFARYIDPQMEFGIIMGAFMGLRQGYITQLSEYKLAGIDGDAEIAYSINFNNLEVLRSDLKVTSTPKRRKWQKINIPIYPGCRKIIYNAYQKHLDILKRQELYPNKYGAVFINDRGKAMRSRTYYQRFERIASLARQEIYAEADVGIEEALIEKRVLGQGTLTPHSLRHYFKQLLDDCERSAAIKSRYLGQKSELSQNDYEISLRVEDAIRMCQGLMRGAIKDYYE